MVRANDQRRSSGASTPGPRRMSRTRKLELLAPARRAPRRRRRAASTRAARCDPTPPAARSGASACCRDAVPAGSSSKASEQDEQVSSSAIDGPAEDALPQQAPDEHERGSARRAGETARPATSGGRSRARPRGRGGSAAGKRIVRSARTSAQRGEPSSTESTSCTGPGRRSTSRSSSTGGGREDLQERPLLRPGVLGPHALAERTDPLVEVEATDRLLQLALQHGEVEGFVGQRLPDRRDPGRLRHDPLEDVVPGLDVDADRDVQARPRPR